jgi:hypothetical protein
VKLWRVVPKWTKEHPKGIYARGAKTYKQYNHALWAYENFKQQGLEVKMFEAVVEPLQWYELTID